MGRVNFYFCIYICFLLFCCPIVEARQLVSLTEGNSNKDEVPTSNFVVASKLVGDVDIDVFINNKLSIVLPDRKQAVQIRKSSLSKTSSDQYLSSKSRHQQWSGHIEGDEQSLVLFTIYNEVIVGRIEFDGAVYELLPNVDSPSGEKSNADEPESVEDGNYKIKKVDLDALPSCSTSSNHVVSFIGKDKHFSKRTHNQKSATENAAGDIVFMDLLAVYTTTAKNSRGGTSGIEAHIMAAVDNANTAFANSGMDVRFNMVHMQEVAHAESDNASTDLNWVANDDGVEALRDTHGADMVSLITDSSYCGVGYVQRSPGSGFANSAFQVTDVDCAVGNLTFAHEHGHNMGMEHDPDNGTTPQNASYVYSFGHYVNGSYRTVMSYSSPCTSGCNRTMQFSNPNIDFNGVATGIANQRHNALTGANTAPIIRDFRTPSAAAPDLVVQSPVISKNNLAIGESFNISVVTRNQGTASSNSSTVRYFLSSNSFISISDTELGSDNVNPLTVLGVEADNLTTSVSQIGTYWVGACIDSVTNESNTNNNCSSGVQISVSTMPSVEGDSDVLDFLPAIISGALKNKNN